MTEEKITITLTKNEQELLILCLNTAREYLQGQKDSVFGAMMGFSTIDNICKHIDRLLLKVKGG